MIPILMYHQIAEIPRKLDPLGLAVPPDQFEQQMSYLARNAYRCLTLAEAVQSLRQGGRVPTRSFVLTYDDGDRTVHSRACPILERFGFTGTVFLVAGCMGAPSSWAGQEGDRAALLLSWAEAQDLVRRGFLIGSHTLSHPRLSTLAEGAAYHEIRNSRRLLQDRLNVEIDYFSYPYSNSDARLEHLVELAGYSAACAGDSGRLGPFHLWRVPCLRDDTKQSFALKASGWYGRRTALRESAPGQLLRSVIRRFRRKHKNRLTRRRGQRVSNPDEGVQIVS